MQQDTLFAPAVEVDESLAPLTAEVNTEKFLLFLSNSLLFGVSADYVVEIITSHTITKLPLVPEYIRGIINLRGQIIPIVDIRIMLGQSVGDNNCIIILNINETYVGILVDTVQKMIDIDKSIMLPAPAQDVNNLVCGMCSLSENQTMLVLDCPQILTQQ